MEEAGNGTCGVDGGGVATIFLSLCLSTEGGGEGVSLGGEEGNWGSAHGEAEGGDEGGEEGEGDKRKASEGAGGGATRAVEEDL